MLVWMKELIVFFVGRSSHYNKTPKLRSCDESCSPTLFNGSKLGSPSLLNGKKPELSCMSNFLLIRFSFFLIIVHQVGFELNCSGIKLNDLAITQKFRSCGEIVSYVFIF